MNTIVSSKSSSEELKKKLLILKPTIDEISKLSSDSDVPPTQRGRSFKEFQSQLQDGLQLVKKLERMSSFNLYRRYRYGKQILEVEKNVNDFMLQQMSTTQLFQSSIDGLHDTTMAERFTSSCNSQVPGMPSFVVGLKNLVNDVKQILIQSFSAFSVTSIVMGKKRGYEVFLSFRGSDVRRGFLSHFYDALTSAGFTVFLDSSEINIGDDISAALHHAIQISGIFIIVFSRNFAQSPWCLKEAALIARRVLQTNGKDKEAGIAIPIFYDVTPSQVRHPDSSPFAEAFKEHEGSGKYSQPEIDEWKAALRTISDLRGLSLQEDANGYEAALVKRVVEDVGKLCNR